MCSFGYGFSVSFESSSKSQHILHYTFEGEEQHIKSELNRVKINDYIDEIFDVRLGRLKKHYVDNISVENLIEGIKRQENSNDKNILLNNIQQFDYPRLISLTGYNKLLKLYGKDAIELGENQVALYKGIDFSYGNTAEILRNVLKDNITVEIGNEKFQLIDQLFQYKFVTDRSININYALIVSDDVFNRLANVEDDNYYWNAILKDEFTKKNGLMQAIRQVNELLNKTNIKYESYLQNMGRQLFYEIAASYTTIYLAIIFLVIANTVIGVQFLMQQQKTRRRYQTIIRLGCNYTDLCKSARKQIKWYFLFPISVAAIGSIFGIRALFSGVASSEMKSKIGILMIMAVAIILVLCVVEFCYMIAVMRMSDKQIHGLMKLKREDS